MEKIDICMGNFAKWRVRQLFVLTGLIICCSMTFGLLSFLNIKENIYVSDLILVSVIVVYVLIALSKKLRPSQKTSFEFFDDFLTIQTKRDSIKLKYIDIVSIEYDRVTFGGKLDHIIIGYKVYINRKSEQRLRLDYDVMDLNNPEFEDTELYEVYKLLKTHIY
jgi:hypothetical protein